MSSTGNNQWEVVVRNPKKAKQDRDILANGKLSKNAKKKFMENAPKVTDLPPQKERETAFFGLDNSKTKSSNTTAPSEKKKKQEKKPEPPLPPEKPPKNLKDAFKALRREDIQSLVESVKFRFPNTQILWLKELASYLSSSLQFPEKELGSHADDPESVLPNNVQQVICTVVRECNQSTQKEFFHYCLVQLAEFMSKGMPCLGFKIMGQIVAREMPSECIPNATKLAELRANYQNRPQVFLAVLWLLGQVGRYDFRAGLGVWLELMVYLLGLKHYWSFCMSYVTELFTRCSGEKLEPPLPVKHFLYIFDFTFQETPQLPAKLHKQLLALYPKLKAVAFAQFYKQYFLAFLMRLQPATHQVLKKELITCLLNCLSSEQECFQIWLHHYPSHLRQTHQLLLYMKTHWASLGCSLNNYEVETLLKNLVSKGEQLKAATSCVKLSQELLVVVSPPFRVPWQLLNCMLILLIAATLAQDIREHDGFQSSRIGRFVHSSGVIPYCEKIPGFLRHYGHQTQEWISGQEAVSFLRWKHFGEAVDNVIYYGMMAMEYVERGGDLLSQLWK